MIDVEELCTDTNKGHYGALGGGHRSHERIDSIDLEELDLIDLGDNSDPTPKSESETEKKLDELIQSDDPAAIFGKKKINPQ